MLTDLVHLGPVQSLVFVQVAHHIDILFGPSVTWTGPGEGVRGRVACRRTSTAVTTTTAGVGRVSGSASSGTINLIGAAAADRVLVLLLLLLG